MSLCARGNSTSACCRAGVSTMSASQPTLRLAASNARATQSQSISIQRPPAGIRTSSLISPSASACVIDTIASSSTRQGVSSEEVNDRREVEMRYGQRQPVGLDRQSHHCVGVADPVSPAGFERQLVIRAPAIGIQVLEVTSYGPCIATKPGMLEIRDDHAVAQPPNRYSVPAGN